MSSLGWRITLATVGATSAVVLVSAIATGWFFRVATLQQIDVRLSALVRGLPDPPRMRPERRQPPSGDDRQGPPAPRPPDPAELFEFVGADDGRERLRSATLGDGESLAAADAVGWSGAPMTATLASGRTVRIARAEGAAPDGGRERRYAAYDLAGREKELDRLGILLGALWVASSLLAAVASFALRRAILRPVEAISRSITDLGPDQLAQRVPESAIPRELRPIVGQLNGLLERVEEAFAREKMTIANIAHELRTPVASLRCTLEFALAADAEPIERAVAERCLGVTTDLQRMIANLLALARIEAGLDAPALRPVEVLGLLGRAWLPLEGQAARRGVQLRGTRACAGALVATCPDQARLVLGNLLENAVTYARAGSTIVVEVARDAHGAVRLSFENAIDHQPPPLDDICSPFIRGDAARTGGDHAGLGLTLVSRLMPLLDGGLRISMPTADRFRVEVAFPGSPDDGAGVDRTAVTQLS